MGFVGAGLGGETEADRRAAGDQRRLVSSLSGLDRLENRLRVVAVDAQRPPAGGAEAHELVNRVGERGLAVDRYAVVVVKHDQLGEPEMAGDGDRFLADALHQVAVRGEHVGVVVDHFAEFGRQHPLGERHADRRREPLAQRTGRRLDPERMAVFRVAGGLGAGLTERLQVSERQAVAAADAGQIEQGIEQHRAVAGRQYEAVAVGPFRVGGVELEDVAEQHRGEVRRAHGQAGMTAFGLLDRVDRQEADRVRHRVVRDLSRHAFSEEKARRVGRASLRRVDRRGCILLSIAALTR